MQKKKKKKKKKNKKKKQPVYLILMICHILTDPTAMILLDKVINVPEETDQSAKFSRKDL